MSDFAPARDTRYGHMSQQQYESRRADEVLRESVQAVCELCDDRDEAWQNNALCTQTDPEIFFPDKGGSVKNAKRICKLCPVRAECLQTALQGNEPFGVWGGLSARERRRLKRGQNITPAHFNVA